VAGTTIKPLEAACAGVILAGVALALAPDRSFDGDRRTFWLGVLFGVGSAAGQGLVPSFPARPTMWRPSPTTLVDGDRAYQRILAGVLTTALAFIFINRMRPARGQVGAAEWRRAWPMVVGNALSGPAFGVACYQWALRTTASGIVLPIIATSPLVTCC